MTELGEIFAELGISQYLNEFIEQGFDTWDTILDITESDFDVLGVKLGHRRKLQRRIANARGLSSDRALASPRNTPTDDRLSDDPKLGGPKTDTQEGNGAPHGAKRKYRRHPKPDENAPERPPSAYVIFSNKMREELKGRNLSFTEIAKLVGENWQNLGPGDREPYEHQASSAKEHYNHELVEYKKTDSFREYAQYLVEFKTRQANQQQVSNLEIAKRPKLEAQTSTASNGTSSSGASLYGGDVPHSRARVGSSASSTGPWPTDGHSLTATGMPKVNVALGASKGQPSSNITSPNVLPGYREAMYGGGVQQPPPPPPPPPRRDGQREDSSTLQRLPRLASISDRRPSFPSPHPEALSLTGSTSHSLRTGTQSHPPPLLTSDSSASNSSYFNTPHTPMEPPLERALPIPSLYPQKTSGSFDSQLPPLRPPSLSPQSTVDIPNHSPNAVPPFLMDYPSSMAPMRGFTATAPQQIGLGDRPDSGAREFAAQSFDDNNLDPVSALLRAGEIVNQSSRVHEGT